MDDKAIHKILLFMKRKPGMSMEAFKDYYETRHAPLAAKYSTNLQRYIRRFITPQTHPETGPGGEMAFDVITELWCKDKASFDALLGYITTSIMPDFIVEDEKNLFDRASFKIATVVEYETDLAAVT
jgi:uncharacterized protein (TIGR02118 family)